LPDILDIFEWMSWGVVMKYGAEIIVAVVNSEDLSIKAVIKIL
jgi:hypothetical protein